MRKKDLPSIDTFSGMNQFPKGERSLVDSERLGGHVRRELTFFRDVSEPPSSTLGPIDTTLWEFTSPIGFLSSDTPQALLEGYFSVQRASSDKETSCTVELKVDGAVLVRYDLNVPAGAFRKFQLYQRIMLSTNDEISGEFGRMNVDGDYSVFPSFTSLILPSSYSKEIVWTLSFHMNTTLTPPYTGNILNNGMFFVEGKFGKLGG